MRTGRYHLLENLNWFRSYEHSPVMIPSAKLDNDKKLFSSITLSFI